MLFHRCQDTQIALDTSHVVIANKRGSSYLIVVSMGYDYNGNRIKSQQKTVRPPEELTPKQTEKWLNEQVVLFERSRKESLLREYQRECQYITQTYDERKLTADDFLFRRQGTRLPMTPTTFTWRFKCILKKNGLPEQLNVHSLRHTAASLMIAGGVDVATVAGIRGHSQPSTTLDIYTHAFDKNKKAASAELQGMLEI